MQPGRTLPESKTGSPLFTLQGFHLLLRCTLQGMLAGLALALLYAAAAGLAWGGSADGLSLFIFLASFGLIPAVLIGGVTGTLIGLLVMEYAHSSSLHAALLGGLIPALAATLLLGWSLFSGGAANSLFWTMVVGLPSLIYVLSGSGFGWSVHRRLPVEWSLGRTPQLSPRLTSAVLTGLLLLDAAYLILIY